MSWNEEETIYYRTVRLLLHIYGIATTIALWVIAVYVINYPTSWSSYQGFQFYMVLATVAVSMFELMFILAFCPLFWFCLWFRLINGWMRACIYAALTVPIFIFTIDSPHAVIWTALLLILALLHLLKSIQLLVGASSSHPHKASTEGPKISPKGDGNAVHLKAASVQSTKNPANINYGSTSKP